jgi:HEAT repeat protein
MDSKIKRLLQDLNNPDDDLRALSAMTLLKLDFPEEGTREAVLKALVKATQDKNISVRFFARKAIDKIRKAEKLLRAGSGEEEGINIDEALNSEDFNDRLAAVMAIKNDKNSEYASRLVEMLQSESHEFVKASLISTLKLFINKEDARLLSPFLNDPDSRVRSNTIEALEYLKAEDAIPGLFSALEDPDNRIRAVAAKALRDFGEEKVFAVLKKMLNSPEEWMKGSAIYALSHIQAADSIKLLIETARGAMHSETRVKAIVALANYHDLSSYSFLKGLAVNGEGSFKDAALRALKLHEEKFGVNPPEETIVKEEADGEAAAGEGVKADDQPTDLASTVTRFFRKGKDEAVGLSNKAAINFSVTGLKKEVDELQKEVGRITFDIYQAGDVDLPELLTMGHEILRMNFFIQKYSEQEQKEVEKHKNSGFFDQLKSLFSKSAEEKKAVSQADKFSKKREELFLRMGRLALKKYEDEVFQPKPLEPYFLSYRKLTKKLSGQQKKLQ